MKLCSILVACAWVLTGPTLASADDWPQWHGPDRTNVSKEKGLLAAWPKEGPKLLWTYKEAGLGFSSVAIVGDRLYTLGARNEEEYAICLDISVNPPKQLWAAKLGPIFTFKDNTWGDGSRSTPTVDGEHVYVLGAQGVLACLKSATGTEVWRKDLIKDFDGQVMEYNEGTNWGYNESPLIDSNKLICSPGGAKGTVVALDKLTGKQLWRTTELKDQATNSSAVVATIGGVRQYVQTTYKGAKGGGVAGIGEDGKLLWYAANDKLNIYCIALTPIVKGDFVYMSAGEKAGCNLYKITKDEAGKFAAKNLYTKPQAKLAMQNGHGGVILFGDHLFGFSKEFACQVWATGDLAWSDRENKLECQQSAALTCADGKLFVLSDVGEVVLLMPNAMQWDEKGRFTIPARSKTRLDRPTHQYAGVWAHPVVANGRLYVRDQELIYCYAVK